MCSRSGSASQAMGESQPVLSAPRLELNWALLGSAGSQGHHPSCQASLIVARQSGTDTCTLLQHQPVQKTFAGGWDRSCIQPSGLAFPRARGFWGGLCGSPALWEQGPRQPRLSMQQGGRSVTHSPLSGADHFKSRWCLKRGIRKNNPHKSGRERGQDGKRQHPSTSSISSCRAGDGANRGRSCAIGVA